MMAKADLGKIFGRAVRCAAAPKRILPFFVVNLVYLIAILSFFNVAMTFIESAVMKTLSMGMVLGILPYALAFIVLFVVMYFVLLYVQASIIDNARNYWKNKEVKFSASMRNIRPSYISYIGVQILVGIIAFVATSIPLFGGILALIVSWLFVVAGPSVIVSKKSAADALRDSYDIFMRNKWQTFLFWLALVILSGIFALIALLPVLFVVLSTVAGSASVGVLAALTSSMTSLAVAGIITALLLAFVIAFSASAKTFYYMQVKKK